MKPSTARLLAFLVIHRGEWISGNRLFEVAGTRYGARLFELPFVAVVMRQKRYVHGTRVPQYRLPAEDEQLRIAL
jgi:hypothetical protein